jgi:hypothetical protein
MVSSLTTLVATHDAKIDGQADDIQALRDALREAVQDLRTTLQGFDKACENKVARIEKAIDDQAKKIDAQATARQWTPAAKATIIAAVSSPFVAALMTVLLNGHGN